MCYALARHRPAPESTREAHEWLKELVVEDGASYRSDLGGGLAIVDIARRPEYADWRRRALGVLARRYGYPRSGWLERLNAEIAAKYEGWPDGRREQFGRDSVLFRSYVVDPLFRDPEGKS